MSKLRSLPSPSEALAHLSNGKQVVNHLARHG